MPEPQVFNFDAEPADLRRVGPTGETLPPINGMTSMTRHASFTGAVHALESRTENLTMLRQLWREPSTLNEIATISGLPLSSVCSLKKVLKDELEEVDHEVIDWGPHRKPTKRTRWRIRR